MKLNLNLSGALGEMGLAPEDVNALFLVPAAMVAWADGEADMKELDAIAETHRCDCTEGDCLCLSEAARQFLYYNFVYQHPTAELLRSALGCLGAYLLAQPKDKADRLRLLMFSVAMDVARSSGRGVLRRLGSVGLTEKLAIANVAGALGFHDIPVLERLMEQDE